MQNLTQKNILHIKFALFGSKTLNLCIFRRDAGDELWIGHLHLIHLVYREVAEKKKKKLVTNMHKVQVLLLLIKGRLVYNN